MSLLNGTMNGTTAFLTPAALASGNALQTAFTAYMAQPNAQPQAALRDLNLLSSAFGDLHSQFTFGSQNIAMPGYAAIDEVVMLGNRDLAMGNMTDLGLTLDPNKIRGKLLLDGMKILEPTELLGARILLFGRTSESFLTNASMESSGSLSRAWHVAFGSKDTKAAAVEDLALLAIALGQVNYTEAGKIWSIVDRVASGKMDFDALEMTGKLTLDKIDSAALMQARAKIFAEEAPNIAQKPIVEEAPVIPTVEEAPTTAIAPLETTQPKIKVKIGGKDVKLPVKGVKVYELIADATQRKKVRNSVERQSAAVANMGTAIEQYLKGIELEQSSLLNQHVLAIISGEIDAPIEEREAAINFIAKNPENAAAYATALLSEALLANELTAPIRLIVKPKESDVRPIKARKEQRAVGPRAVRTDGGAERVAEMAQQIQSLSADFPAEMEMLAEENPGAFSPEALTRLGNMAHVHTTLQTILGPGQQIQYAIDAEDLGQLPRGFVGMARDRKAVEVTLPPSGRLSELIQSLDQFRNSPRFAAAVAENTRESSSIDFNAEVAALYKRYGNGKSLSEVLTLAGQNRFDEARSVLASVRNYLIAQSLEIHINDGFTEMYGFDYVVANLIAKGDIKSAEVILDHVESWTLQMDALVKSIGEISDELIKKSEKQAAANFNALADKLLRAGDIDALRALMADIRQQLSMISSTASVLKGRLTKRTAAASLFILESIRSLGAITDGAQRAQLAARVPSVDALITADGSAAKFDDVRAKMAELGIPVPGEVGVLALDTRIAPGLTLQEVRNFKQISGPGSKTDGNDSKK